MARIRAEKKSKKSLKSFKRNKSKVLAVITIIMIIAIAAVTIMFYDSPENNQNGGVDSYGKWLFAMDTAQVQYIYSVSAIPTLVIVDTNGDVIYYNQGMHYKELLLPYIESAIQGTAESLGESIDFTLTTFNNEEFTLSNYKGKVVLLDFMGVGCLPCEMQMPELQKIKQEKGDDIVILSIDTYYSGESEQDVRNVYGEYIKE